MFEKNMMDKMDKNMGMWLHKKKIPDQNYYQTSFEHFNYIIQIKFSIFKKSRKEFKNFSCPSPFFYELISYCK